MLTVAISKRNKLQNIIVLTPKDGDLDGDSEITLDQEELALAEWFEREEIPVTEINISLTNEMILAFKNSII